MMTVLGRQCTPGHAVLVTTVALLTGCSSGMACTMVTCSSGVVAFAPATIHGHDVKRMKICLNGSCKTIPAVPRGNVSGILAPDFVATKSLRPQSNVKVSVTLESASDTNLITARGSVQLHKFAPNGVSCGPVCYHSSVEVHLSGTLSAVGE
jgi:hypothetical protein